MDEKMAWMSTWQQFSLGEFFGGQTLKQETWPSKNSNSRFVVVVVVVHFVHHIDHCLNNLFLG